jgi:ATP/ADP translocase
MKTEQLSVRIDPVIRERLEAAADVIGDRAGAWQSLNGFVLCGLCKAPILSSHRVVFSPRFIRDCRLGESDFLGR